LENKAQVEEKMSDKSASNRIMSRRFLLTAVAAVAGAGYIPRSAHSADPIKVASIFATPIEEPWDNQIHVALLRAAKELGIEYKWSEKVGAADFSRVMAEYANGGYQLVLGDAFAAEREARRTAKQFPKTAFLFGSGSGPAEPNFGVFDNWIHEPAYLSGLIAGKMSKSGIVGAVAAMGIPEVNRLVNAFFAGAREANPDVKKKVAFIGSFFDPPKAKEAALAQIEAGVDVIYAERFGVIEAAKEKGILAISNMSDQHELAPDTVVTGPIWDMYPTVQQAVKLVQAGVFTAMDYGDFSRMVKGGSYLAPYHNFDAKLPAEVKDMVAQKTTEITDGNLRVDVDENTPVSD
jgi:basic membrane protein A